MAFDQTNNSRSGVMEISTNSIALFSADSTMLRIGFQGDTMFITLIPRVADPNGGKARWPKELGHSVAFRPQNALALYEGFRKKILPDIENGNDHNGYCVVPMNREASNLCGFSFAGGKACFTMFYGVNADRTCADQYTFMFEPTAMIDTYNPNTGTYSVFEVQAQLFVITEALRTFGALGTNYVGHGARSAMAWNSDMVQSHLRAIVTKLGATPGQCGRYRGMMGGGDGTGRFDMGDDGSNYGGGSSFAGSQMPLNSAPTINTAASWGNNDNVTWSTGMSESANIGQTNMTPVQQVSDLESIMS